MAHFTKVIRYWVWISLHCCKKDFLEGTTLMRCQALGNQGVAFARRDSNAWPPGHPICVRILSLSKSLAPILSRNMFTASKMLMVSRGDLPRESSNWGPL